MYTVEWMHDKHQPMRCRGAIQSRCGNVMDYGFRLMYDSGIFIARVNLLYLNQQ